MRERNAGELANRALVGQPATSRVLALVAAADRGGPRAPSPPRRYGAQSREIRAFGRIQNRVADLAKTQLAVMNARAHGDPHRVEIAEERVSRCMQRLAKAALSLDCVRVERGDEDGRRLVEGALRLTANV